MKLSADITALDESRLTYNKIKVFFIYSTIFVNSIVFFTDPFEFYAGYLIYILLLPGYISRLGLNRSFFFIFLILLFSGIINIFLGNNTTELFFKVYTGLALSYFFYYYVIVDFKFDIERLFKWYLKGCYIAALIGIFQFISFLIGWENGYLLGDLILTKWGIAPGGIFGIRINSIFPEPTHLGACLSAAFFVSVYNLSREETYVLSRFQSIAIIIVYILSFSALAQTGIFLTLIFLAVNFGLFRYILFVIPAVMILFNVLYNNVEDFRGRFDGLVDLYSGEEFQLGKTHGSSFILFNNYTVAMENFKTNFVFGTGVGSHPVAFEKYSLAKKIKVAGFNLNSADANSMLLRLISETGLFGVGLFGVLIFRCYIRRNENINTYHWLVSNGIIIMILLNLFRQGHYFLNGFPFFVLLYYYNYESYEAHLQKLEEEATNNNMAFIPPPLQNIEHS